MKRVLLHILILSAVLCGCERTFDISGQIDEGTVWMSFIPSNDYDTTFFIVQATTPLAGSVVPVLTSGESVEVRVNGQTISLEKNYRSVPDRLQFYATDFAFHPGDKIETVATVPGTGAVSASCRVPESFPNHTWEAKLVKNKGTGTLFIDLEYDDNDDEGGFYGAAVLQDSEEDEQSEEIDPVTGERYWTEIRHYSRTISLQPSAMTSMGEMSAASEDPVSVIPRYYNYLSYSREQGLQPYVQIWKDVPGSVSSGGRHRISLALRCNEADARFEFNGNENVGSYWTETSYKYQIVLYRFSESFYNYLKAQYNKEHNGLSAVGLAPASFVYTNVKGGAGVCGAYTVNASGWFGLD